MVKGDKVRVYSDIGVMIGVVKEIKSDRAIVGGKDQELNVHVKQCRRIKQRKRVWIGPMDLNAKYAQICISHEPRPGWIEFREAKK